MLNYIKVQRVCNLLENGRSVKDILSIVDGIGQTKVYELKKIIKIKYSVIDAFESEL